MFSHLKAEDFVNLIEGVEIPAKLQRHLDTCSRCSGTWEATRSVRNEITSLETDIPEPDWDHFRSSVRDQLLSRSIQRQSAVRRWTGWSLSPATAWALSLFLAVGATTLTVLWRVESHPPITSTGSVPPPVEAASEAIDGSTEKSLFDDVVSLGDEQQDEFRQMLESAQKGIPSVK